MSIYFQTIKHKHILNIGFFLKDGLNIGDMSTFHEGDQVSLLWNITKFQYDNINGNIAQSAGVRAYKEINQEKYIVHIPFEVVKRRRALSFREQDQLSLFDLGISIYLQAENGYWEDIFKWVVMGEKPTWADEEEKQDEQ